MSVVTASCPVDGAPGSRVPLATVRNLVRPEHRDAEEPEHQWYFCDRPDCEVVYFDASGRTIKKDCLKVSVGVKEKESPRTVCYCFNHTVESITEEIQSTGKSSVAASIAARVKAGECRCELLNPKGVCCLGDVNKVVKDITSLVGAGRQPVVRAGLPAAAATKHDCCETPSREASPASTAAKSDRASLLVAASVVSAAVASACCWLPLLLIAFGASAAGVSAGFERWRPVFLGIAPLLLGAAFYLVYFRKERCAPGGACAVPDAKSRRLNRILLWVATVLVIAFAAFPKYSAYLIRRSDKAAEVSLREHANRVLTMRIGGMTCEACAARVQSVLGAVPGVRAAAVSYSDGTAAVTIESGAAVASATLVDAVERVGYEARLEGAR